MGGKRVVVILSEAEYVAVCAKAGQVPLSRWFRNLAVVGQPKQEYVPDQRVKEMTVPISVVKQRKKQAPQKEEKPEPEPVKHCRHGLSYCPECKALEA